MTADDDGFDVCPYLTCPLYGKAVMADHRHLDTPAAKRRAEAVETDRPLNRYWTVLTELRGHLYYRGKGSKPDDPGWHACSCGWEGYWCDYQPHVAEVIDAALGSDPSQTSANVDAPPEERAPEVSAPERTP